MEINELIREAKVQLDRIADSSLSENEKVEAMRDVEEKFYSDAGMPHMADQARERRQSWNQLISHAANSGNNGRTFFSISPEQLPNWH